MERPFGGRMIGLNRYQVAVLVHLTPQEEDLVDCCHLHGRAEGRNPVNASVDNVNPA